MTASIISQLETFITTNDIPALTSVVFEMIEHFSSSKNIEKNLLKTAMLKIFASEQNMLIVSFLVELKERLLLENAITGKRKFDLLLRRTIYPILEIRINRLAYLKLTLAITKRLETSIFNLLIRACLHHCAFKRKLDQSLGEGFFQENFTTVRKIITLFL